MHIMCEKEVTPSPAIQTNDKYTALLAQLMRAEAEGDGELGMLMVDNVGVNHVIASCLDFGDFRNLKHMEFRTF